MEIKPINRITGRAGTGKTTYLLNAVGDLLDQGIHPSKIAMVTLTNAGADVFRERAINQFGFEMKDLEYFKTLHKIAWKLCGLTQKNIFGQESKDTFVNTYYPDSMEPITDYDPDLYRITASDRAKLGGVGKLNAMINIRDRLLNTMIGDYNFDKMYNMTGLGLKYKRYHVSGTNWSDKYNKYTFQWQSTYESITEDEQIAFSDIFDSYLDENDLYTFTQSIRRVYDDDLTPPVEYLFLDEFQDFTKLQYECMCGWIGAQHIKEVWAAGDDAQTVYRFAGADAIYMIGMQYTNAVFLPKIYRYGQTIADNAKPYIARMTVRVDGVADPCETPGEVLKYYGDEWLEHIKLVADGRSVLILAATKQWVNQLLPVFEELAGEDVNIVRIENAAKIERVFRMYNIIASLERGEIVERDAIESLFKNPNFCIPSKMVYTVKKSTFAGMVEDKETVNVLKHVKSAIRTGDFKLRDFYDKAAFVKDFLNVSWSGLDIIKAIPEIEMFERAVDLFPSFAVAKADKRIGTIHKAKGDQADTVILFMSVPYPTLENLHDPAVRDDLMRQFYVGTTRPERKLIEIYYYLQYGRGEVAPAPLEVVQ